MATVEGLFTTTTVGLCRAVTGHAWKPRQGTAGLGVKGDTVYLTLDCDRGCGCTRYDQVSMRTGEVTSRQYAHPGTYKMQLDADERLPKRQEQRREAVNMLVKGKQRRVLSLGAKKAASGE